MTWQDIPGWFTFPDLYREQVARAADGAVFVEVGVFLGRSAGFLATEIRKSRKRIDLYCVDPWDGSGEPEDRKLHESFGVTDLYAAFLANMEALDVLEIVHPVRERSPDAGAQFRGVPLDFVFIDGAHDEESVRADIEAWWPLVRSGGVLAGHDIDRASVAAAVRSTLGRQDERERCWVVRKP